MRRFQSRYESLLRIKEQAEQVAQLQQESAQKEFQQITALLRQLEEQLEDVSSKLANWMGTELHASQLLTHRRQVERLQHEIVRVRVSVANIEATLRQTIERRVDLMKEVEKLRCVRETELREYRKEKAQSNQRISDDHAVRRWGRTSS